MTWPCQKCREWKASCRNTKVSIKSPAVFDSVTALGALVMLTP